MLMGMQTKNDFTDEPHTLLILGAGGLGQVAAEMAQMTGCYSMIAFLDDYPTAEKETIFHIVGKTSEIEKFQGKFSHAIPAFGDNQIRHNLRLQLEKCGFRIPRLIHKTAIISPTAQIGDGAIIRENVVISRQVVVGKGCLINIGAMIDHECQIGDDAHIPMGAIVRNNVAIPNLGTYEPGVIIQ